MRSSTQAYHDMLEEEEYARNIAKAEEYIKEMTPESMVAIGGVLKKSIALVESYGMGTRTFWGAIDEIEDIVNKMPG